jgi:hypothetical protein
MKTFFARILVGLLVALGVLLLFSTAFYGTVWSLDKCVTGIAQVSIVSDQNEVKYDVKIKNPYSTPIHLCGGQMNWCGQGGCYRVLTSFPIMLEPKQDVTITVSISPREETLSETELILYADGRGLGGLTPVKIKLPAVSLKSP